MIPVMIPERGKNKSQAATEMIQELWAVAAVVTNAAW